MFSKKILILLFFSLFLTACFETKKITYQDSNHLMSSTQVIRDIKTVNFMWEDINLDEHNFFRERIEREFYIIVDNIYQYKLWVKRTWKYFPYFEEKLQEYWLPDDLKYLAVAESFLRHEAYSSVWASWLWQFMPATAREYWLLVNDYVDQRNDYTLSTISAFEYLSYLGWLFDYDWKLALSAYNKWQWALSNTIVRQWSDDYFDLLLNTETRRFVPRILAIKLAYENREKLWLNLKEEDYYFFPDYELREVEQIQDIYSYLNENNISVYDFIKLNPWININQNKLPLRDDWQNWTIKIPI